MYWCDAPLFGLVQLAEPAGALPGLAFFHVSHLDACGLHPLEAFNTCQFQHLKVGWPGDWLKIPHMS